MKGDQGWVVVPLMVIIVLLLFVIATKGPPDELAPAVAPAPINVTVQMPASPCVISDMASRLACGGAK